MDEDLIREIKRKIQADENQRRLFTEKYGHIRRPIGLQIDGKHFMALEGSIFQQTKEGDYNFVNAIHDHCLHFFGESVLDAEDRKPLLERHPAIQWLRVHLERRDHHDQLNQQDGFGASWFRFAYDLFTIRDNSKLESALKERLLIPSKFQAARYELKVAAICATAGFDLAFEDESDNTSTHPEFIGTCRFNGSKIAVEAKSRHRHGVLGFGVPQAHQPTPSLDVRGLLLDAFRKHSELPLYVFIDPNLPPRTDSIMAVWQDELERTFLDLEAEGYLTPCPANAVLVTNDPSHYVGTSQIGLDSDTLWARCYTAPHPATPHPDFDVMERLLIAHKQRVAPPTEFYENP